MEPRGNGIAARGFIGAALLLVAGCASLIASALMDGVEVVPADYRAKTLVRYRVEATNPPGEYSLVEIPGGEAILEVGRSGGALIKYHWRDEAGDHFAGWHDGSIAWEYIVPLDRTKPAKRFVYRGPDFYLADVQGQKRPVPFSTTKRDPVVLVPN